jgi:serine/threonine protein kinase
VKGKYPYMSPEQIVGGTIDRRVDVYALGLVLYELLTNTRAIAGQTEVEQIDNARSGRIRPIEQLRPNTPVPLRQIIASCLFPDPEGRYPTALELSADLEKYLVFERHVVGREDLLRLFRVVAAEAKPESITLPMPSESGAEVWLHARSTEQERPVSAVVLPEGAAQTLPFDDRLGSVADTSPSLPPLRADLSQATTAKQMVLLPSRRLQMRGWWLGALIAAAALAFAGMVWRSRVLRSAGVADGGLPVVAPLPRVASPEDAGREGEPYRR